MVRTRVGYTGGTKTNPTYYNLGDHTETVQIDYDPKKISYAQLLDIFWKSHDPTERVWSRQYMHIIFYHNEDQRRLALETKAHLEEKIKRKIYTGIVPAKEFYLAEDYHQKYYLRQSQRLMTVFNEIYAVDADFVASTAAARINGYLGGNGKETDMESELKSAGLPSQAITRLLSILSVPKS